MHGGGHSFPGVELAACNINEDRRFLQMFPANVLKLLNSNPTRRTTVISCLLNYHFYCASIPHQYKW